MPYERERPLRRGGWASSPLRLIDAENDRGGIVTACPDAPCSTWPGGSFLVFEQSEAGSASSFALSYAPANEQGAIINFSTSAH
jgi:hypothetical protein